MADGQSQTAEEERGLPSSVIAGLALGIFALLVTILLMSLHHTDPLFWEIPLTSIMTPVAEAGVVGALIVFLIMLLCHSLLQPVLSLVLAASFIGIACRQKWARTSYVSCVAVILFSAIWIFCSVFTGTPMAGEYVVDSIMIGHGLYCLLLALMMIANAASVALLFTQSSNHWLMARLA